MYNPLYIVGGIAIHGSLDVPAYPASHGCIRVPMFASQRLPRDGAEEDAGLRLRLQGRTGRRTRSRPRRWPAEAVAAAGE